MNEPLTPNTLIVTKEHRRFVEFCEACRRYRYIGLCYGSPGVGKTLSARAYAQWDRIETLLAGLLQDLPADPTILPCRTIVYTPEVTNTPNTTRRQVQCLRNDLTGLIHAMRQRLEGANHFAITYNLPDLTELIIVDEADRLKMTSLEQIRDFYDRNSLGLVLIGMPGIEKRLARYPQFYSRVGFVHHFKPLSAEEMQFILQHKWQQLGLQLHLDDFTDVEATAAITRITGGNFRLLQRLFNQIDRVMEINHLRLVTKEVVEAARELLVIGSL